MKPWTVILRESPDSTKPSYTREANLPIGAHEAWDQACYLYGKVNILAILPGSFKNRIFIGIQ
jgi:hypothetical protein